MIAKIMIIDDSFTSRLYIKKCVLMTIGEDVTIVEAREGEDALRKLHSECVDLILSDVNMPIMSGFTFMRNLKDTQELSHIPVIFITSLANEGRIENLMDLGAFRVLKKPLTPALLSTILTELGTKDGSTTSTWGA